MRARASALLLTPILACALAPAAASAAAPAEPREHRAVQGRRRQSERSRDAQRDRLRHDRVGLRHVRQLHPGARAVPARPRRPARSRPAASRRRPSRSRRRPPRARPLGDSPNPFFNVWRSYSEPGGIADEMRATRGRQSRRDEARADRHDRARQADPRDQDDRRRAQRAGRHAPRAAVLGRSTTRASGSRPSRAAGCPVWFAEHKNDPKIKEIIGKTELWFMPIQNVDGYDFTFTCGLGADQVPCDYRTPPTGRPTTASGARRSATTTTTASTATARTASTRTATTRPSAASTRRARATASASETYRGPYPLSEPATSRSTACSAASSSTATSTTTPTASCC